MSDNTVEVDVEVFEDTVSILKLVDDDTSSSTTQGASPQQREEMHEDVEIVLSSMADYSNADTVEQYRERLEKEQT